MVDFPFLLAIGAIGWGLSLATYRFFATRNNWPMGALHADLPFVPFVVGAVALAVAAVYVVERGLTTGGGIIVLFGLLLWLFWTGFLRVGSQISLFLAPLAAALLLVGWLGGFGHPNHYDGASSRSTPESQRRTERIVRP
jgi:hypothetical protein